MGGIGASVVIGSQLEGIALYVFFGVSYFLLALLIFLLLKNHRRR